MDVSLRASRQTAGDHLASADEEFPASATVQRASNSSHLHGQTQHHMHHHVITVAAHGLVATIRASASIQHTHTLTHTSGLAAFLPAVVLKENL